MTILLVDNYDSFTYNLFQYLQSQTQEPVEVIRNDACSVEAVLARGDVSRIVLSPGPGHPDVASDFGICRGLLETQASHRLPILGVCLGHQGLASVWGAKVVGAGAIVHGKTSQVAILLDDCPLMEGLPNPFEAMRYHSLVVEEASLPPSLRLVAKDETHGLIMALQHESLPLYGVQFHPESIGTPQGKQLLWNFLHRC